MEVKRITEFSESVFENLNALYRQQQWGLNILKKDLKEANVKSALADSNVYLMGLYDESRIVGMVTLTIEHDIDGVAGDVENVVLDEAYRGRGFGKKMISEVITLAKQLKVEELELTSRRERIVANKMYPRLGFKLRNSNAYTLKL